MVCVVCNGIAIICGAKCCAADDAADDDEQVLGLVVQTIHLSMSLIKEGMACLVFNNREKRTQLMKVTQYLKTQNTDLLYNLALAFSLNQLQTVHLAHLICCLKFKRFVYKNCYLQMQHSASQDGMC